MGGGLEIILGRQVYNFGITLLGFITTFSGIDINLQNIPTFNLNMGYIVNATKQCYGYHNRLNMSI